MWKGVCSSSPCSRKHLVAVLYFRGLRTGREHQLILQKLAELKKQQDSGGDTRQMLFTNMPTTVNTNLPSCFSLLG